MLILKKKSLRNYITPLNNETKPNHQNPIKHKIKSCLHDKKENDNQNYMIRKKSRTTEVERS